MAVTMKTAILRDVPRSLVDVRRHSGRYAVPLPSGLKSKPSNHQEACSVLASW
jgi:hypothetical protein